MKWLLSGLACLTLLGGILRADQAGDLYAAGGKAFNSGDYKTAAQNFDQIITSFPTTAKMEEIRVIAGLSYLRLGEYDKAIDRLSKDLDPVTHDEYRTQALYYTGLAQLLQGGKLTDEAAKKAMFLQSAATMTQLVTYITSKPTPDNETFEEDALYNRALAYFYGNDLDSAEKDLQHLLQKFTASLRRPDYLLLLGNLYAREASDATNDKKPDADVVALADKSLAQFDLVSRDSNALVQANSANLSKAEVLYLVASLQPSDKAGYEKALDAFRLVHRKADMIKLQQDRLDTLKAANQVSLQTSNTAQASANTRLIDRETGRLTDLKNDPDPIIQALIRIAECYNALSEGDQARTVLHRLLAHAVLEKDQRQEVDFALIFSYVLGDQPAKADKALSDYLHQHPGDPQAEGIIVQISSELLKRKDYAGALKQADLSLTTFPKGVDVSQAIELKADALTGLGKLDEARKVEDDFLKANPGSSVALGLLLARAQGEGQTGDFTSALADYQKVKDDPSAGTLQPGAAAGYIQTLQSLNRFDDVIQESKAFAAKYPDSPLLPNILVMGAVAMDRKGDHTGAVAALQDVARKYPKDTADSPAPFALYYVVNIYQRTANTPGMIQAAQDLGKAFPNRYPLLLQAADIVSAAYVKQKNYDLAVAEYQPLTSASDPEVAATAYAKIGDIRIAEAKASIQRETLRADAQKQLASAEQSYIGVLKNYPDQLIAIGDAFQGLDTALTLDRSWGFVKDADLEDYLTKLTADITDPDMKVRLELAKAGLVFIQQDGDKHYPAALARFKAAITAHPSLVLTRQEADRYGQLLIAAKDYSTAEQVYTTMLQNAAPNDQMAQADADYGLGATALAQGDVAKAKDHFLDMKKLSGGAAWHSHIADANFGIALAAEQSGQPGDLALAKQTYGDIIQAGQASVPLQARATLGYGRILEKEGFSTTPQTKGSIEYAVYYFQQVNLLFGSAVPELSAEGLYDAGQAYDKAGDKADAKKQYQQIESDYKITAPDWAAKAEAALAQ